MRPMALQTQHWISQDFQGKCLAHAGVHTHDQQGDRNRPYAIPTHPTLKKLGFEQEKGQLKEWMTVVRETNTGNDS
jgi:hypothetical protein